ncbi:MAG: CD0519/CD1768 family membrane protein [Bacteroides sp.]
MNLKFRNFRPLARPKTVHNNPSFLRGRRLEAIVFLVGFVTLVGILGCNMGTSNLLNSIMKTAFELLTNTVFFIMAITVLTGALAKLFIEFGVMRLIEFLLRPLMRPLYHLPGVAALAAVITFFSDNPAIMSLAKDKSFRAGLTDRELVSMTNFGTSLGMGLIVITFMSSLGFFSSALIGFFGAMFGGFVATRLMQFFTRKFFTSPTQEEMEAIAEEGQKQLSFKSSGTVFERFLNAILDGGKTGVDLGLSIIPGVLIISTFITLITFGPKDSAVGYQGLAGEGVPILTWLASKIAIVFQFLFGFHSPSLIAFPVTSLGSVGAALSLLPRFQAEGILGGNEVAVFTAMGMCWSGFLSTYAAMFDTIGFRVLTSKAILAQTLGGLAAGIFAHAVFLLVALI